MAQRVWLGYDITVSSGQWNDHQRDVYGSQVLQGFRVRALAPASMVLDLRMGSAHSNVLYVSGVRIEETSDIAAAFTIAAANPTYARKDVLVCRYVYGSKGAVATYVVIPGTPAASPIEPPIVTASDCKLAVILIQAGAAAITDADITPVTETTLANPKFRVRADGTLELGDGAGVWDIGITRVSPGVLGVATKVQAVTFRSTVLSGAGAPFEVASGDLVTNLNAEKVGGYRAGNASGQIPVSNSIVNVGLIADQLDGYHADATAAANAIPVRNAQKKIPGDITGDAGSVGGRVPGLANGVATLDAASLLPLAQIPATLTGKSADKVGGYGASAAVVPGTVPVRSLDSKIPGDITGDAQTVQGRVPAAANGLATLGGDGKVPAGQLPGLGAGSYIPLTEKGQPNGVAPLDASALLPLAFVPADLVGKNAASVGGKTPGVASGLATLSPAGVLIDTQVPANLARVADLASYKRANFAVRLFGV